MSLLSIENLTLSFGGNDAVDHVSLNIEKGEMVALVGESGSGKSLTALSCLGLQPPAATVSGSIVFNDREIVGAPRSALRPVRGKGIGMIFQEPMTALNPLHTVGRQIGEMLRLHGTVKKVDEKISALLDQVGMAHFKGRLDAYPHQLSGGERQRVMIAMAIANDPQLLIADEPTTAVDVTIQAKILKLIKQLQKDRGMAVLFITHDLTVVKRLADKVAIMKEGKIAEQGKVSDIFAAPKHEYTRKLIASEPKGEAVPLPAQTEPVIECDRLKVHFPIREGLLRRVRGYVKAVDGVTLSLPKGATLGVVGESGSGKTTLAFALLRLIQSQGRIVFLGKETDRLRTAALRPLRKQMQIVFQDPFSSLNPRMSVAQIIEEGLKIHEKKLSAAEREKAIISILEEVGLAPDTRHRFPHEFSGGQRQRIAVARAMVLKPKFVVLDEPTSALDLTVQTQILDLLKNLQVKHGLSYMFISHDLRVVRAIAHDILVLRHGEIVEQAPTPDIFQNPENDYTKTLIDAALLK